MKPPLLRLKTGGGEHYINSEFMFSFILSLLNNKYRVSVLADVTI
jgi:hypothetical protein